MSGDWIGHDGQACPVAVDTMVDIRWWDGRDFMVSQGPANVFIWTINGEPGDPLDGDIVAYREVAA